MSKKFADKDPVETVLLTLDYAENLLQTGETINSAMWNIIVFSGTDPSPNAMLAAASIISGTTVSRLITGGIDGVVYKISCTVYTSIGQVLKLTGTQNVRTQT